MTNLARLGEQIADLQRLRSESQEFINVTEQEIMDADMKILMEIRRLTTIRQIDLAVF